MIWFAFIFVGRKHEENCKKENLISGDQLGKFYLKPELLSFTQFISTFPFWLYSLK